MLLDDPEFISDLKSNLSGADIARKWGCAESTARRHRLNLNAKDDAPRASVEGDASGFVEVGPDGGEFRDIKSDKPITDWSRIFEQFNLDPEVFEIVGDTVRMSMWQSSKRTDDGDRDVVNLYSYRAQFTRKRVAIDLPALYAELRKPSVAMPTAARQAMTAVVAWADIQTGKVDERGDTATLLARLDEKRVRLAEYLAEHRPERVVVADVGDIVEGFENVPSQQRMNDLSLMEQVDVAATEFWKTIKLCAAFAPVDVLSIPSNHAQWRQGKGLIGKPTDDWGLHISQRLEHLAREAGFTGVTFHRPEGFEETLTFDIRGTILGLAHGHQASSADRVTTWWSKMTHANVMDCDVLLTGHFHHARFEPSGRSPRTGKSRWWMQAPTLDNGSAWVRNSAGADSDPGLLIFGITDDGFDLGSFSIR